MVASRLSSDAFSERRAAAAELVRARGLPSGRDEAFRFSPLRLFAGDDPWQRGRPLIPATSVSQEGAVELIRFSEAWRRAAPDVGRYFGSLPSADHAFAQLNTALFEDGIVARVHEARDPAPTLSLIDSLESELEQDPLQLGGGVRYSRVLVIVDPGCRLKLIELHDARGGTMTNSFIELVISERASVEHVRVVSGEAIHLGVVTAVQGTGSRYQSSTFSLGGPYSRLDLSVRLSGEGASCKLDGFFGLRGREHADLFTSIDHASAHTESREAYKGLLAEAARGVFDGTILVRKAANGTEARQESRNLLLSDQAIVNTKPHLAIEADDVKCGHGATVGHIDEDELFYLTSRGIDREAARAMVAFGFAEEVLRNANLGAELERSLRHAMLTRIPGGARLLGELTPTGGIA